MRERTVYTITGRWHYTHKRLRTASRSLRTHMPYLFTCQNNLELRMPNTTNSLDGSFAHLKELVRIHRGLKHNLKRKMILHILQNRTAKN